jgi:hypothetical protein
MAFGNHTYEEAVKLAASKTKELGRNCVPVPSADESDKWTIGIEIKAMSGADLMKRIKEGK